MLTIATLTAISISFPSTAKPDSKTPPPQISSSSVTFISFIFSWSGDVNTSFSLGLLFIWTCKFGKLPALAKLSEVIERIAPFVFSLLIFPSAFRKASLKNIV